MTPILIEGENDNSVAARLDALRCDLVKSTLYPERQRIARGLLELVRKDPSLKMTDEEHLSSLCLDAMFYFGEDVFSALQLLQQPPGGAQTVGDRVNNLQTVLQSYFDLRTLK
jgi:hypothetical protein